MSIVNRLKTFCPWKVKTGFARLKRTGIILMYHRINNAQPDPWQLNVSPDNFDEHMRIIKKYAKAVQMHEMGDNLSKFNLTSDEIAVTFDDGFSDNFYLAKPILEKYDTPATFYIPSNAIEYNQEFWWDRLSRILSVSKLPKVFEMSINNTHYRWNIDSEAQEYSKMTDELPSLNSLLSKRQLLFFLWKLFRPLAIKQQNELVDNILLWSGRTSITTPICLPMTINELIQMANSKLFEIGAHTVHHPFLSAWSLKEQEEEIQIGRQKLEGWINKKVTSFAYPFGNYSNETPSILERLSFNNACVTVGSPVKRNMNRFLLPRYMVFNWDANQFEQNLRYWLTQRI